VFKKYFNKMYADASSLNRQNILSCLQNSKYQSLLDVGCSDGEWTNTLRTFTGVSKCFGIDSNQEDCLKAKNLGIQVICQDLGT